MNDLWFGTSGPHDAEIVIVGEAWGAEEAQAKVPFVGGAGNELSRMLAEAGIDRSKCLLTNIVASRPMNNEMWRYFHATDDPNKGPAVRNLYPTDIVVQGLQNLSRQIVAYPRRLVIGTGNYPLWALTDCAGYDSPAEANGRRAPNGIMNWRGSMWYTTTIPQKIQFLPVIHPSAILKQWALRAITVHDLKARVPLALRGDWRPNPEPTFWAPPTFEQAKLKLEHWIRRMDSGEVLRIANDIETVQRRLISCIGFADSVNFAMCIPFIKNGQLESYWPIEQEIILVGLIRRLLSHPNVRVEGQNYLYDTQYINAHMAILPRTDADSMLMHHLLWPGTPKGLDYISSLYCHYHWYWKEDGKEWDAKGDLKQLLDYNCLDCIRTFEAVTALRQLITQLGMERQWNETKQRMALALRMMLRGVRIDRARRGRLKVELTTVLSQIYTELEQIIPQSWLPPPKKGAKNTPWYRSPKQQQIVFGEILGMKIPKHRKTGRPTLGKEAMQDLPKRYPEFTGLFSRLEDARSVAVFQSHFVEAPLDTDDRMRCSFNPAGTETFRWNSSANAFGSGTNLQNIPQGDEA